jgi:hypothetical protein
VIKKQTFINQDEFLFKMTFTVDGWTKIEPSRLTQRDVEWRGIQWDIVSGPCKESGSSGDSLLTRGTPADQNMVGVGIPSLERLAEIDTPMEVLHFAIIGNYLEVYENILRQLEQSQEAVGIDPTKASIMPYAFVIESQDGQRVFPIARRKDIQDMVYKRMLGWENDCHMRRGLRQYNPHSISPVLDGELVGDFEDERCAMKFSLPVHVTGISYGKPLCTKTLYHCGPLFEDVEGVSRSLTLHDLMVEAKSFGKVSSLYDHSNSGKNKYRLVVLGPKDDILGIHQGKYQFDFNTNLWLD